MQGNPTLPSKKTADGRTLADVLAAGELTCSVGLDQMLDQLDQSGTTLIEVPAALVDALRLSSTGGDAA